MIRTQETKPSAPSTLLSPPLLSSPSSPLLLTSPALCNPLFPLPSLSSTDLKYLHPIGVFIAYITTNQHLSLTVREPISTSIVQSGKQSAPQSYSQGTQY